MSLGYFATAEEAALSIARFPRLEREKSAGRAEAQPHVTSDHGGGGGGGDAGEEDEGEEGFELLDAVEVLDAWTDDDDDTESSR